MNLSLERIVMKLFHAVEPIVVAFRKSKRLEFCGADKIANLPTAEIELPGLDENCNSRCPDFIARNHQYLRAYDNWPNLPMPFRGFGRSTPMVIDIGKYASHEAYEADVKTVSKGAVLRNIRKARRENYVCRQYWHLAHVAEEREIRRSKKVRAGGPVAAALMPDWVFSTPSIRRKRPPDLTPKCARHWRIWLGCFAEATDDDPKGSKLVAYAIIRRMGNCLLVSQIFGHGDHLKAGVVHLLQSEIVKLMIEGNPSWAGGLRYLLYGSIEHGNTGLLHWKLKLRYRPYRLAYEPD